MTAKELLIEAFRTLDYEKLNDLLDDKRSYMGVSKDLFLATLKDNLDGYRDLKSYETVVEGICNHCNIGCKAYKFKAKDFPSLPLFFEENDGTVTDIYLCNAFSGELSDAYDQVISFSFYEEEKIAFEPTLTYSINLQKIERAVEEFKNLQSMGIAPVEEMVNWYNKFKYLSDELGLNSPFTSIKYKAYLYINSLFAKVSELAYNFNKNDLAKKVLEAYHAIDLEDEKSLVRWLMQNRKNYFFSLEKTDNWRNTGFLIVKTNPSLVVDCSGYLDGVILDEIYHKHLEEMMEKYKASEADFQKNGGYLEYSLESRLRIHNKYLDLL
jgi:hypothetical protein